MFAGNFAPAGWWMCDGSVLAISEYETLFNLIGTTYGGDGQSTFALPDMRGRVPIHFGNSFTLAQTGGVETVTLSTHNHPLMCSQDAGIQPSPVGFLPAASNVVKVFSSLATSGTMATQAVVVTGGNQPHDNFQPYLCLNFIISLFGIFPSPT